MLVRVFCSANGIDNLSIRVVGYVPQYSLSNSPDAGFYFDKCVFCKEVRIFSSTPTDEYRHNHVFFVVMVCAQLSDQDLTNIRNVSSFARQQKYCMCAYISNLLRFFLQEFGKIVRD